MDLNYKLLGKRIKEARLKNKLTQEDLAEMVGVSSVYISHIEVASSKPSLETLVKICNSLNTTPDYLLFNSLYVSKEYINDEFANLLDNCSPKDLKLILELAKTVINHED